MSTFRRLPALGALVLGAACFVPHMSSFRAPATSPREHAQIGSLLTNLPSFAFRLPEAQGQSAAMDRLVLIKSL